MLLLRFLLYEVPDCAHNVTHIKTLYDAILKKRVFAFDLHLNYDNDRCKKFDRQRTEIKVFDRSPGWMMGRDGKTFSYSWKFKLQENFTVGD